MSSSETSSLYTVTDSIRESLFRSEGGRKRQAVNESYLWPCDRTASQFELFSALASEKLYGDRPYWEPRDGLLEEVFERGKGVRIADLGSGVTASWCITMAERFPAVDIIGVDLTPSELLYLPPNVTIEIYDLLEGLPFPDDYLDMIHSRFVRMAGFLTNPRLDFISEIARVLKPGGIFFLGATAGNEEEELIHSRVPHCPYIAAICARTKNRSDFARLHAGRAGIYTTNPRSHQRLGLDPLSLVKAHDAFKNSTSATRLDAPLGSRPDQGPPEKQLGTLIREGCLLYAELEDIAAGIDEETVSELRRSDRALIPEHDVGLYVSLDVVWAVKEEGG